MRSLLLGTALGFVTGWWLARRPVALSGSGPQVPPFVAVDPSWARTPSMMHFERFPNFIGRDHWWMPRTPPRPQ